MLKKRLLSSVMASIMAVSAFSVVTSADATATTTEAPVEETKAVKTKAELKAYVDGFDAAYKAGIYKFGTYAAERWLKALDVADVVLNDATATDQEISNAYYYVKTATDALKTYTKDELDGLVKKWTKTYDSQNILNEEMGDQEYTSNSYDVFIDAYDQATGVDASDAEGITNAYVDLENAVNGLAKLTVVTKSQYTALVKKYDAAKLIVDKYETWRRGSATLPSGEEFSTYVGSAWKGVPLTWDVVLNGDNGSNMGDHYDDYDYRTANWWTKDIRGFNKSTDFYNEYENLTAYEQVNKTTNESIVLAYNLAVNSVAVITSFKPDSYNRSSAKSVEKLITDNYADILTVLAPAAVADLKANFTTDGTTAAASYVIKGNTDTVAVKDDSGTALADGTAVAVGDALTIETTTTATEKVTGTASGTYFEYVAEKPATYKAAAAIDASYTKVVFKADNATVFTDATAKIAATGDYVDGTTYYTAADTEADAEAIAGATQSVFTAAAVGNIFADSTGTAVAADDVYDGTPANYFVLDTAPVPASYKIATLADGTTVKVGDADKAAGDVVNENDVIDATIVTTTNETVVAEKANSDYYTYTAAGTATTLPFFDADGNLTATGKTYLTDLGGLKYRVKTAFSVTIGSEVKAYKKTAIIKLADVDYVSYATALAAMATGSEARAAFELAINYLNGNYGVSDYTDLVTTSEGKVDEWGVVYRKLKYTLDDKGIPVSAGKSIADLKKLIETSYSCDSIESAHFQDLLKDVISKRKQALQVVREGGNGTVSIDEAYAALSDADDGAVKHFNDELANYKYSYGEIADAIYAAQKIVDEGKYTVDDTYKAKIDAAAFALISLLPSDGNEEAFDSYDELVTYARLYTKTNGGPDDSDNRSSEEKALLAAHEALVAATKALEEAPEFAAGDVDGSGKVDTADALLILDYSVDPAKVEGKTFHVEAADVNGDKTVDTADALAALDLAVKA